MYFIPSVFHFDFREAKKISKVKGPYILKISAVSIVADLLDVY